MMRKSVFSCLAALGVLLGSGSEAFATTTTYQLSNGWAPYGNDNGVYFYKPGAAFYGDFGSSMFLELTQLSDVEYQAKLYGEFQGFFQTQNGQLSVNPAQNAHQFNSTEGTYAIELSFNLQKNFPNKYPNNFSTFSEQVVGSITNPLGMTSAVSLAFADKHGISFGVNIEPEGIHAAGWFNVAAQNGIGGVKGDFYFDGAPLTIVTPEPPCSEVPEPGTLLMLGAGTLGLLRKKVRKES